jgi:hydrogenase-4 component F
MNLYLVFLTPLIIALAAALVPSERLRPWLVPLAAVINLLLVLRIIAVPAAGIPATGASMFGLDPLGRLILLVVSLLYTGCAFYGIGYFRTHPTWSNRTFIICLLVFLSAMSFAAGARHLGLLWVAVEATTIVSAPLIYFNRNRFSIEATWKYLLLCSVGIALAMLGILFVAYAGLAGSGEETLQIDRMMEAAPIFSKPWLRTAFVFLLVGFGTKMGLAPLHTWKPDAYGEAPGLAGGLLAGGLTSIAFLAVLRVVQIMNAAGEQTLAYQSLLFLGLLSLGFAATFVIRQRDIKRMLAYSSVEHMGILAIGVAIGGMATYGAMFHVINNALAKGCLFMSAGNIHRYFGSKKMCETQGAVSFLPWSASIFLVGFLAIAGSPPFGPFISEFTILRGIFSGGNTWIGIAFISLLAIIFVGMSFTVTTVALGPPIEEEPAPDAIGENPMTVGSPLLFLLALLILGFYLPQPLQTLLHDAAGLIEVNR